MGDDVQTIKAGIMEIADIFAINKSDRDGAERVEREIRAMQSLSVRSDNWTPPIVKTVANDGTGVPGLLTAIESYRTYLGKSDRARDRRVANWRKRIAEMLRDALFQRVVTDYLGNGEAERLAAEVAEHKRDPYSLVEEIVGELGKHE
jgi:LAO/AO transport system kinase